MCRLILDRKWEHRSILKGIGKQGIYLTFIYLLFYCKFVLIREVEGNLHIRFPHTAFHIEHGKGMLVFVCPIQCEGCFFRRISISFYTRRAFLYMIHGCLLLREVQPSFYPSMSSANIQRQLPINKYPYIIISGELKDNRHFGAVISQNLSILCQSEFNLQFCTKSIVIIFSACCSSVFVKREKTISTSSS